MTYRLETALSALWVGALAAGVAVAAWTLPAVSQEASPTCAAAAAIPGAVSVAAGGDMIVLAPAPDATAQVCYHNGPNVTGQGDYALTLDGMTVRFHLRVGVAETLTVMPPAGYMVWPPEGAETDVEDGQSVTVQIIMGVS